MEYPDVVAKAESITAERNGAESEYVALGPDAGRGRLVMSGGEVVYGVAGHR